MFWDSLLASIRTTLILKLERLLTQSRKKNTFSPIKSLFRDKKVNGQTIKVLDVEPLTKRLREYFDCSSLEGAYLENEGTSASAASHFERKCCFRLYYVFSGSFFFSYIHYSILKKL